MKWQEYPYSFENLEQQLSRIDAKKQSLDEKRPLPAYALKSIKESLSIEWTFNSNGIEGNTLTLQETKLIIEKGITIKGKSLKEHFEAFNHQNAIEFIEKLAQSKTQFTDRTILEVHELVLASIEKEIAGRYRTSGVRISGANFTPPNALKVNDMIEELIHWVNKDSKALHPIISACIFHHRLVWIHPFFDGNGRTVRLLFNLLLMKQGFPPAIILKNDRKKYYDALNKANEGDYSKLLLLMIQAMERSLDIYLSSLNNTHDEYKEIQNIVEEMSLPYSQEYVSLLARKGKIDAYKQGKNWLTTEKAVQDYFNNRKRKRSL